MAIELGTLKQKAAEAREAIVARERAEAERVQAEQEAKGHEGELIAKELEAASQELSGAETSLAEAQQFAETDLAILKQEYQEKFRSDVAKEQENIEALKQKITELQARKGAMEAVAEVPPTETKSEEKEGELPPEIQVELERDMTPEEQKILEAFEVKIKNVGLTGDFDDDLRKISEESRLEYFRGSKLLREMTNKIPLEEYYEMVPPGKLLQTKYMKALASLRKGHLSAFGGT